MPPSHDNIADAYEMIVDGNEHVINFVTTGATFENNEATEGEGFPGVWAVLDLSSFRVDDFDVDVDIKIENISGPIVPYFDTWGIADESFDVNSPDFTLMSATGTPSDGSYTVVDGTYTFDVSDYTGVFYLIFTDWDFLDADGEIRVTYTAHPPIGAPPAVLGTAMFTGGTGTITLDADVPADGTLQIVWSTFHNTSDDFDAGTAIDSLTDTNSIPWIDFNTTVFPLIGELNVDNSYDTNPPYRNLYIGSSARACTKQDLLAGDEIDVVFTTSDPPTLQAVMMLVYVPSEFTAGDQNGWGTSTVYGNSDGFWPPDGITAGFGSYDPTALTWDVDEGLSKESTTTRCAIITAMAAYPPILGFVPHEPSIPKIAEIEGVVSLAVCVGVVEQDVLFDPGGTWPEEASMLAGNYQVSRRPFPYIVPTLGGGISLDGMILRNLGTNTPSDPSGLGGIKLSEVNFRAYNFS